MKVKFLKDHLSNKADDEVEINNDIALYLIRLRVAEKVNVTPTEKKKTVKPVSKKQIDRP